MLHLQLISWRFKWYICTNTGTSLLP